MTEISGEIFLGTSGWSYKEWIGPFYTQTDKSMLRAYTRIFKTVEIDSTFYRYPSKGTVFGWTRYSPEGFVYAAKLPRLITHDKKLDLNKDIENDLERYIDLMEPLALSGKLGCILIQLPPRFDYKPKQLEDFFKLLPTHMKFAVEFRDPSWMRNETWSLLQKYKVAYTIVDEPLLPPEAHLTSEIAYVRWHGRGARPWYNYHYSLEELKSWPSELEKIANKVKKVYGYFNNHFHGYAVENCLQIMEMIGALHPKQIESKRKIEGYRQKLGRQSDSTLDFFVPPKELDFQSLITYFVSPERLERARRIEDSKLTITKQTDNSIEATVTEYHIVINSQERTILHDCADWVKMASTKKLCKHLTKLLLEIGIERATALLRDIYEHEKEWQYRPYSQE